MRVILATIVGLTVITLVGMLIYFIASFPEISLGTIFGIAVLGFAYMLGKDIIEGY